MISPVMASRTTAVNFKGIMRDTFDRATIDTNNVTGFRQRDGFMSGVDVFIKGYEKSPITLAGTLNSVINTYRKAAKEGEAQMSISRMDDYKPPRNGKCQNNF